MMQESLQDGALRLFGRNLDKNICAIDHRSVGGDISVGRHPADGAIPYIKTRTMARTFQLVAVQATAGQGAVVVGAAVLEGENFPADPAQDDEEFTDLVDTGLSFSEVGKRGYTDCAGIHFFRAVEVCGLPGAGRLVLVLGLRDRGCMVKNDSPAIGGLQENIGGRRGYIRNA